MSQQPWENLSARCKQVLADSSNPVAPLAHIVSPAEHDFASVVDHTLLKPDTTPAEIDKLCDEAITYNFKSCCVNGANVKQVAQRLAGKAVIPCAVVGFPLGAGTSSSKAFEATQAVRDGAKEIDMVINIGALKSKHYSLVHDDIKTVVDASNSQSASPIIVKVIIETFFLTDEEKIAATFLAAEAGADFVKTCTGFLGGGADAHDVALMRKALLIYQRGRVEAKEVKVKASAGVRTFEKCLEMFKAGAERIGTSSAVAMMQQVQDSSTY